MRDFLSTKTALLAILSIISISTLKAQTLDERFEGLKEESESYKQYKVIERTQLDAFWNVTMDSINGLKQEKANIAIEDNNKAQEIEQLNESLASSNTRIEDLEMQTSTIEVFGLDLEKGTFIFISFFTIGALVVILAFVLYQFKDNNKVARAKVKQYEKLNDNFEEYKRNALEKQMKLRRELQTERNKLEEARNV